MIKQLRKLIKNRGMKTDILLSHFMILIIPIIVNIIIEGFIIGSVKDATDKSGYLVAENARTNIDAMIGNAQQITQQINKSERMQPVYQYAYFKDNYEIKNSIELLRYTCQNSYDIDNIFVYNIEGDLVITPIGRGNSKEFVECYYNDTDIDYERWQSDSDKCINESFRIVYRNEGKEAAFVEYMAPLTGTGWENANSSKTTPPAVIIIRLNMDKFKISDEINRKYPGFLLYAVASDGSVIGNEDIAELDGQYILSQIAKDNSQIFERDRTMYICSRSEKNDWIYVAAIPIWKYNKFSLVGIIMVIIGTAIVFLLGIKLIKSFIKTNYGSVINLSNRILNELNADKNIEVNNIDRQIEWFLNKHTALIDKMEKISDMYYSTCVLKLLNGVGLKNDDESFIRFKAHMNSDLLCVVCCSIEDCSELYSGSEYMAINSDNKIKDAEFIIFNVLSELLETEFRAAGAYINNKVVILVGNNGKKHTDFKKEVSDIARQFADRAAQQFKIQAVISVGDAVNAYADAVKSYDTALGALPYAYILKDSRVVSWDLCAERNDRYEITAVQKDRINDSILAGNINGAIDIINELYEKNLECRKLSIEMIKCFVMDLAKVYDDILAKNSIFEEKVNVSQEVFKLNRVYMTKNYFEELSERMCNIVENNRMDKYEDLVEKIQQYIDEFFSEADLNVFLIANTLGLSRAYISKIFKGSTGESILDAIHKRRVEEAKKLLKEGYKISDVAEKTGYVNANVFIRNFKKYTGITPGQYRESMD